MLIVYLFCDIKVFMELSINIDSIDDNDDDDDNDNIIYFIVFVGQFRLEKDYLL